LRRRDWQSLYLNNRQTISYPSQLDCYWRPEPPPERAPPEPQPVASAPAPEAPAPAPAPRRLSRPAEYHAAQTLLADCKAAIGGLFEPTETRYAEIAREMQASGDWLVPRLNGIMHLHKPPLAYWAAAIGMNVMGEDAGARIPAALAGVVMLIALACATRRRFATLAGDSPLAIWLLGSAVLFVGLARSLASDPFLGAGVALFWACAPSPWALAGIGIGFLAKGPVVLVHTLLPLLVLALWPRNRRVVGLLAPAWGWSIAAAIALPWFVAVIVKTTLPPRSGVALSTVLVTAMSACSSGVTVTVVELLAVLGSSTPPAVVIDATTL